MNNLSQKTQLPNPPLPAGAVKALGDFCPEVGLRTVTGPNYGIKEGNSRIVPACEQARDGLIVTKGEEAPCVLVVCDEALTPAEAREMAERLLDAARLVEAWTVNWNRDLKRNSGLAHPCRTGKQS